MFKHKLSPFDFDVYDIKKNGKQFKTLKVISDFFAAAAAAVDDSVKSNQMN